MFAPPGTYAASLEPGTSDWGLATDPMNPPNLIPQFPGALASPDWREFTPGQAISFKGLDPDPSYSGSTYVDPVSGLTYGDLGFQVQVTGSPAYGDKFLIKSSDNQSLFDTVKNLIDIAQQPIPVSTTAGNTEFMNDLGAQVSSLDRALDNVLRVRASVGSRLQELDSLSSAGSDLDLQYTTRISNLQDLDYAEAISNLSRNQMQLEAAQAAFVRVTSLSLFSQMG